MKTHIHIILALAFAAITASANPATSDADPKLSVTRGKQNSIALKADAKGRLTAKAKTDAEAVGATITARMKLSSATPFAVEGDATRPYLVVTNGFEKPIYFRVFAREKGSKESVEVQEIAQPVSFGKNQIVYCFKSGSLVEEVTLSHFSFSKE